MKKILLIEDYKISRDLIQNLLEKQGFSVVPAKDGEEGLSLYNAGSFDLILVDLILPRISAYSLIQELRSKQPTPKIAVLYTIGSESLLEPLKELGISEFMLKSSSSHDKLLASILTLCPPSDSTPTSV